MSVSWTAVVTWLIVGSLAGALTGLLLRGTRYGYGKWANLAIGLVGALIGGAVVNVFGIQMGLASISVSVQDLLAAFLGSLVFLAALRFWKGRRVS